MAYKVKCAVTGEYGTSDTFVKHDKKYYKSEQVYQEHIKNMEYRQKTIDLIIYDYMGWTKEMSFPSILVKRLKEIEHFGYETIYRVLEQQRSSIEWAMENKEFNNDYPRMMYILGIVKNNIFPVWKVILAEKREARKQAEQRASKLDVSNAEEIKNPKQKVKDISKFLEG